MTRHLIHGDPLHPQDGDVIVQIDTIRVGEPVPDGWRVLTGGMHFSQIARVALRYEIEAEAEAEEAA